MSLHQRRHLVRPPQPPREPARPRPEGLGRVEAGQRGLLRAVDQHAVEVEGDEEAPPGGGHPVASAAADAATRRTRPLKSVFGAEWKLSSQKWNILIAL